MCCPRCHEFGEDCFHLVVDCIKSWRMWDALHNLIGSRTQADSIRDWQCLVKCCWGDMVREASLIYCVWFIWKDRNAATFERCYLVLKQ